MAKLENVKVNPESIEFNGADYELVDGNAEPGDIVMATDSLWDIERGDYFLVNEAGKIRDNAGAIRNPNHYYLHQSYRVFRKKAEQPSNFKNGDKVILRSGGGRHPLFGFDDGKEYTIKDVNTPYHSGKRIEITNEHGGEGYALPEQLKRTTELSTVKRPAKVGERILIVAADPVGDNYRNGDVLTVTGVEDGIFSDEGDISVDGVSDLIELDEYEVIVEEKPAPTFKVGDYVKAVGSDRVGWGRPGQGVIDPGTVGKVVKVIGDSVEIEFDKAPNQHVINGDSQHNFLLRKGEFEKTDAPTPKLKVGDYAKVVGGKTSIQKLSYGDIVEIRKEDAVAYDFRCYRLTDGKSELFDRGDLVPATDEEVEAAKKAAEPAQKLAEGDIVIGNAGQGDGDFIGIITEGPYGDLSGGNVHINNGEETRIFLGDDVKLLAPKSARVDL